MQTRLTNVIIEKKVSVWLNKDTYLSINQTTCLDKRLYKVSEFIKEMEYHELNSNCNSTIRCFKLPLINFNQSNKNLAFG